MKKLMSITMVLVLVAAFIFGALAPASQAVVPQKCWYDCIGGHYVECCKFVVKGSGSFTRCWDTGYWCAY